MHAARRSHDKPSFRTAYRRHRCLLPADGFYEWMALPTAPGAPPRKQPVHIGMHDGALFGLGGLYERWRSPEGDIHQQLHDRHHHRTNAKLKRQVHERMPLIVAPEHYARWLDPAKHRRRRPHRPISARGWWPISRSRPR